jgi:peptidoglycan/xylan/chitin deacetylase (PgdA/CDA1 family)
MYGVGVSRRGALWAASGVMLGAAAGCDASTRKSSTSAAPSGGAPPDAGPPGGSPGGSVAASGPGTAGSGALPAEVTHGPLDRPNVALTFHGQGDPVLVGRLLDALAAGGTKVTVLAVGTWVRDQPALVKRVLDAGHEVGNHTQNHRAIAGMAPAQAYAEINDCAQGLRAVIGSIGSWFRPSQTQYSTPAIREQAARVGYRTCLSYDVDSLDYTDPAPAVVVRTTLGAVRNGSIVSMHFGHAVTVTAIPQILDGLRQRGLRPVTMTELMA